MRQMAVWYPKCPRLVISLALAVAMVFPVCLTLGRGGSINPLTQQVSFSVGNYSVAVPAGSFFKVSNGYVYQQKVNNIFLCLYIIKNKNTPGRYSLLANSRHGALTGTITSPLPMMLTVGDNSGTTQMNVRFD